LRDEAHHIRNRGADLAVVGSGTPEQAAALADELGVDFPLLADPQRRTYVALGARRSLAGVLHPAVLGNALRAWRGGFRQQGVQGDAMQLGGVVAIRPDGEVAYLYQSARAGDHPPLADVAAAL
jgi:hypothetical protein